MYDFLIVGAGFTGCTIAERIASQLNKSVVLIDKRNHIGGNSYDYINEDGILIHKYGPHIFHTNDEGIWQYVNKFSHFNDYLHKVKANVGANHYYLPINLGTINEFFNLNLSSDEIIPFLNKIKVPVKNIKNAEEAVISKIGWELYEAFYKNYTIKQWGCDPKKLDAAITQRLPIRFDMDNRYFSDKYQGIPSEGYNALFNKMIDNKNIELQLNVDFFEIVDQIKFDKLIYTGPIDVFFDKCFGSLPYRSLNFEFETLPKEYFQNNSVINYPNDHKYTRIVEYKYFNSQKHNKTTISREYPCWNDKEPYYPVPSKLNYDIYNKYKKETEKLKNVIFCGRLANYKYYNMDQCIGSALSIFRKSIVIN